MTLEDLAPTMKISEVKAKLVREKHIEVGDEDRFVFGGKNLVDGEFGKKLPNRATPRKYWGGDHQEFSANFPRPNSHGLQHPRRELIPSLTEFLTPGC